MLLSSKYQWSGQGLFGPTIKLQCTAPQCRRPVVRAEKGSYITPLQAGRRKVAARCANVDLGKARPAQSRKGREREKKKRRSKHSKHFIYVPPRYQSQQKIKSSNCCQSQVREVALESRNMACSDGSLDFLIHHIFLPPKMSPSEGGSASGEVELLRTVHGALEKFRTNLEAAQIPALDRCIHMLGAMRKVREAPTSGRADVFGQ